MRKPSKFRKNEPIIRLKSKEDQPIIKWLDIFMERYGMSFDEFKTLPVPTFYALANEIIKESEEQRKKMKHG